jgi:hypothetical protein
VKSIIEPLLRDHAKLRTMEGELRAFTERFDVPGMRQSSQAILDLLHVHNLKEAAVLYLIGMKFLKADNKRLPDLLKEHDQIISRLYKLGQLLFSARLTNIEDQARQMVFVILESSDHHMADEESVVWPALDKLIDDETKMLILRRYEVMDSGEFDELDRLPLMSLPDNAPESEPFSGSGAFF